MQVARPTKRRRSYKNNPGSQPKAFVPPPVTPGQKSESLDRRIRNIEALDNGIFIGNVLASYMALPGLVGFWPMSSVQRSTGNAYDLSGQGRTLTYNGNPAYTYYNGLVPYIDFDGTGDYLSRTDETDLDIIGNESVFTSGAAGLTVGGWFWADAITTFPGLMNKWGAAGQRSFLVSFDSNGSVYGGVTTDGSTEINNLTGGPTITASSWNFIVFRFIPSTELITTVNALTNTLASGVPATIFNSTATFEIGARTASNYFNGRAALCFLCANALGDELISALYQQSRVLFGV